MAEVLLAACAALLVVLSFFVLISHSKARSLQRLPNADRLRVWHIGWALAVCILGAISGLAVLTWVALALLNFPRLPHAATISIHDLVGVLQLVFASVAGAGALVALVMAYRRQKVAEVKSQQDRTRLLNERFTAIARQLGDRGSAVRMAGVYAMAGLADDWDENRQTCIDVLCAYLRMPYNDGAKNDSPTAHDAEREIRQTITRLVAAHLGENAIIRWDNLDFDFTGVLFHDDIDFSGITLTSGNLNFKNANFLSGTLSFRAARLIGGTASFKGARFAGATVVFDYAELSNYACLSFDKAEFLHGTVSFRSIKLSETSSRVDTRKMKYAAGAHPFWAEFPFMSFDDAVFSGGTVQFNDAKLLAGIASFTGVTVSSGMLNFSDAEFVNIAVSFGGAEFDAGVVTFHEAQFHGRPRTFLPRTSHHIYRKAIEGTYSSGGRYIAGTTSFGQACFNGSTVLFTSFFLGGNIDFEGAAFTNGTVSFENAVFDGREPTTWDDLPRGRRAGAVTFDEAKFTGAKVILNSKFLGGTVDLSKVSDWSCPPDFNKSDTPHRGVILPGDHTPSVAGSDPPGE